jgi:serine/threonine protein kinase
MGGGAATSARFEILRPLGEGGMGVVYEAIDRERDARVALKTLRRFTPEGLARFKREFRALEGLHHRNLVALGELVCDASGWFFTMELVDGLDFLAYVRPWYRVASSARLPEQASTGVRPRLPSEPETLPSDPAEALPQERDVPRFEEERLRRALPELAAGLLALHEADRVHRDVKPSNIRVAPDGRVVLLDFGLVGELGSDLSLTDVGMAGTPAYMAPEQAACSQVGPAADWYSVGVILYEALTGRPPFVGAPAVVVKSKQTRPPPPPGALVRDLPVDLEQLCIDLLQIDPFDRPRGREVLRRLGTPPRSGPTTIPPVASPRSAELVGRSDELRALREAFDASEDRALAVVVHGASGIGKSALVQAFAERLATEGEGVVVLRGRCHEREAVPFKALDDVVDRLCQRLRRLPEAAVAALAPVHIGALTHVFPVLRRIGAFEREADIDASVGGLDRAELRRRAFGALRELFTRLARRARVVVIVDDLHWADADSLALLGALLRPPEAPPLLFVVTTRDASCSIPGEARKLAVGPLLEADARELARRSIERSAPPQEALTEAIAAEGAGHPLFIDELARHAGERGTAGVLKLDDALWSRVERLAPAPRRVIEVVAVACVPLAQHTVARAAALEPDALARAVALLRAAHLARTGGARGADKIEPYHDRVREAVVANLPAGVRRARHEELARALESARTPDVEALAVHWREAGWPAPAREYAVAAAEHAWHALAFDRAAEWYQAALAVPCDVVTDARRLRIKLADALANAGRGVLAAAEYRRAASESPDDPEALGLLRSAAEQLLRSGHYDEAIAVTEVVLASARLALPSSRPGAIVALLFWRAVLALRGLRYRPREAARVPADKLLRIDTWMILAAGRGLTHWLLATLCATRALLLALQAGEPKRLAAAMASELTTCSLGGGRTWARTEALMQRTQLVAARADSARAVAWATGVSGFAYYVAGQFRRGLELLSRGEEMFLGCGGKGFEIARCRFFAQSCLWMLGELKEARARAEAELADAEERGDEFLAMNLRTGLPNLAWLMADDPDAARRATVQAMAKFPAHTFLQEHLYEIWARVHVELYAGDAETARLLLRERLPAYRWSFVGRLQMPRIRVLLLRARCALADAAGGAASRRSDRREEALREAERAARAIARERMAWSDPAAALVRAAAAKLRGDEPAALDGLRRAVAGFDAAEMALDSAVARTCLGRMMGGAEGAAMEERALVWMRAQTVQAPGRIVAMLAPGLA